MTSLHKRIAKFGRENKQIIHYSKDIDKSYPIIYFLLNLSHCVNPYGIFCHILDHE